jgi:peptide deformylase
LRLVQSHNVERADKVKLEALDETGTPVFVGASGLLAQVFQHECDHLDGILYTDHAHNVYEEDDARE